MKKNDTIKLDISDMTKEGLGLAKVLGQVFFVKDGLVGDKVEAIITKVDKNIVYTKVINILEKSKYRVGSACDISNACGGCQLLNLAYKKQIEIKKSYVLNCLKKIGNINNIIDNDSDNYKTSVDKDDGFVRYEGIIEMDTLYNYRNKMQVPFAIKNGNIIYGFYAGRTHNIIEFDKCKVGFKGADEILKAIKLSLEKYNISVYDEKTHKGIFREVMLRKANNLSDVSITYIINDEHFNKNIAMYKMFDNNVIEEFKKNHVKEASIEYEKENSITNHFECTPVTSTLNINTNSNNVIFGNKNVVLRGNGYIEDKIRDIKFHVSPESFYQVNSFMTKLLYDTIIDFADFIGEENVLDLYCGIGTISLYIAKHVKNVLGIEVVEKAIENAKENASLNNITNVNFLCKDLSSIGSNEQIASNIVENSKKSANFTSANSEKVVLKNESYDTIIVDPPRKGLDSKTIAFIENVKPKKIIYVSCDPATLSRDLKTLCYDDKLYKLERIKNVDMFPHTMHIETIVKLTKV